MPRLPRPLCAAVASGLAVAACASSRGSGAAAGAIADPAAGQPTQSTTLVTGGTSYSVSAVNNGTEAAERALVAPPDTAFYALVLAYQGVGAPPNTVVSSSRTVGVRDARFVRVLGKRRLSEFFTCGSDATGMPLADQYRLTVTALSRVSPGASGGSVVATQASAVAQSLAQSTDPVRCASTGRLEAAVNALAAVQATR